MKKLLLLFLFFFFPCSVFAQLDVYLSLQNLAYGKDVWTSSEFPDTDSSSLLVERQFYREDFPSEYIHTSQEIKALTDDIFSSLTPEQQQDLYNSLMSFDEQDFAQYISIALAPEVEANISDKQSNGFMLTSFESTFHTCGIDISARRSIIEDLILDIHNGIYADVDSLQYTDIRFGDCIIPFPDVRRGTMSISDSFSSNKLIAEEKGGNHLSFGAMEDSVDLFSLAEISLEGLYEGVQENSLLELQSTRVEDDISFEKKFGEGQVLYVHQNHYIDPFKESLITGDDTSTYLVGGVAFENHELFLDTSNSEEERTFSPWMELQEGIYAKTLIQEATYSLSGGVYIPRQEVGASTYYAILYNYDTTDPECLSTLFSHENSGDESFLFPDYPWFHDTKYGYFVCSDDESGCLCDSSDTGCFLEDDIVLSIPQEIEHDNTFAYTFQNRAGLNYSCQSPIEQKLFYDTLSPDVRISLPGIPEATFIKEYVSNNEVLYDGEQVAEKRFYHLENDISYQVDENLDIELEFYDPYDPTRTEEGISGLSFYNFSIFKLEDNNWEKKIEEIQNLSDYNPEGTVSGEHASTLNIGDIDGIEEVITQVGQYQVYINILDGAGNEARVIFYFDIRAGEIDTGRSILEVTQRDSFYADNVGAYQYSILLRDAYGNPVEGTEISGIEQSCDSVLNCYELKLDMTGETPSGDQAIEIFDIDTISDQDGKIEFSLRSRMPGVFTEAFTLHIVDPVTSLQFLGENNTFLFPIEANLEVQIGSDWVSDDLPVNQIRDYRVHINDTQSFGYIWTLSNFGPYLRAKHPDTNFVLSSPLNTQGDGVYFSGNFMSSLSSDESYKNLLEIVDGDTSAVVVSYMLTGELVRYRLYVNNTPPNLLHLGNVGPKNPVKIIGNLQGVGNTHNLDERQNITDIDSNQNRKEIRINIGKHINRQQSDSTARGVKYIDKTDDFNKSYILESDPDFETLIVRNGNILVQDDFNTSGKVIGLISYIDTGYSKENGFENIGNIYVDTNVTSIHAFIYADGALVSTESGNPVSGDITMRDSTLQHQLFIKGSLFTRNTLGGASELAGEYMLPGGEITIHQDLATQYDLHYTRRGNEGCEKDIYGFCNMPHYFIIEYDARISSTPPILFSN